MAATGNQTLKNSFDPIEVDYAYLAGIIDGEGHVGLYRHKDAYCKRGFTWRVVLCITNSSYLLLLDLQRRFGGRIEPNGKSAFSGRQIYGLRFSANAMRELLPRVLPYLVLKRQDVNIMLRTMDVAKRHRFKDYDDSPMEALFTEMEHLRQSRKAA